MKQLKKNRPKTPTDIKEYKQMSNKQTNKKASHDVLSGKCELKQQWQLYAPIRMAKPRILTTRCDTTGSCCWWVCKMAQQPWKAIWQFLKKPNTLFPNWLATVLLNLNRIENFCAGPHKNLHADVYSSFLPKTVYSFQVYNCNEICINILTIEL